ncbi:NPCBM/NEW2 domain-containing protein [Blastopirellula sp. JC732]|uniref:NPCBM/NEW2 domain-containing protein n=1 Tax=Blastopirellula sediminis TaxID=2894196 RepID=A0A9X1SHX2_9BACT|nr:NPCBM/NEW2 domain-containing protein [Blastopirellula sediminis]MCC9604995.1 NPCBM/NEW2 domain-containing protein [Blastopirellula sediminis]MCC9631705.1 NPCBM/NEW2 domain-containing protein [Blastopirellula sediminis]
MYLIRSAAYRLVRRKGVGLFLVACSLLSPLADNAYGWGRGHKLIRSWAVASLPDWQKELLAEEHWERLRSDYTSLQDRHAGGKSPELDRYCLPPVRVSLHDVGTIEASLPDMQWYLQNALDQLAANEPDEALKFLGVLCHWNEDPGCPCAHSSPIDEATLRRLLPPTPEMANKNFLFGYGGVADIGNYVIPESDYEPQLLGTSVPEAAAQIYQRQRLLRAHAAGLIIPLMQANLAGDTELADKHRQTAAIYNAKHTADILYTAFCLHTQRFEPEQVERLASQPLTAWESDATMRMIAHPYYVTPYLINQAMDAERNLHPLAFAAEKEPSEIRFGLGMGTPYALPYKFGPGGVYDRFTCRVGLHPTAGEAGRVAFAVIINGKEAARTDYLTPTDPPQSLDVPLPDSDVVSLVLQTIPHPESNPLHNLTVWGEPTLHRAD